MDFSHIGTLIAALYGGPWVGLLAGILVGFGTGIYFGFLGGSLGFLGLIGLPLGKAMTGFTVGLLAKRLNIDEGRQSSLFTILVVLLGYLPECLFTVFFFNVLVVIFLPTVAQYLVAALVPILIKAWIEIAVMSFYVGTLSGNKGFSNYIRQHFT